MSLNAFFFQSWRSFLIWLTWIVALIVVWDILCLSFQSFPKPCVPYGALVPLTVKQPLSMMLPPPCLTTGIVFLEMKSLTLIYHSDLQQFSLCLLWPSEVTWLERMVSWKESHPEQDSATAGHSWSLNILPHFLSSEVKVWVRWLELWNCWMSQPDSDQKHTWKLVHVIHAISQPNKHSCTSRISILRRRNVSIILAIFRKSTVNAIFCTNS